MNTHSDEGQHLALKCDDASKKDYATFARLPFNSSSPATYLNLPDKLSGTQALYACTVKEIFSDSRPANFLARHGMAAAKLSQSLLSLSCEKVKGEFGDMQTDLQALQQSDPSAELDAFTADVTDFNSRDCDGITAIMKNEMNLTNADDPVIGKLRTDFCTWKKTIERARPGSTAGMSYILAPCRNDF